MHHLVPLVHQSSPQTTGSTNQKDDTPLSPNHIAPLQASTNQMVSPQALSANQRASLPSTNEENTITDKRQINEDLQVYKMENGTRSKFSFSFAYFLIKVPKIFSYSLVIG